MQTMDLQKKEEGVMRETPMGKTEKCQVYLLYITTATAKTTPEFDLQSVPY